MLCLHSSLASVSDSTSVGNLTSNMEENVKIMGYVQEQITLIKLFIRPTASRISYNIQLGSTYNFKAMQQFETLDWDPRIIQQ